MLKTLWKRGKIAPEEQFLPLSKIFYYLMLDFYVKTGIRFSVRDKRLFEITEVEITRVDCIGKSVTLHVTQFNTLSVIPPFPEIANFGTKCSMLSKVYVVENGIQLYHCLSVCTGDSPLSKAREFSTRTGGQTMIYL